MAVAIISWPSRAIRKPWRRISPWSSRIFPPETQPHAQTIEAKHGRIEIRTLYASDRLNAYLDWPQVGQVVRVDRVRRDKRTGECLSAETHWFVTRLTPARANRETLLKLCREHWTIENKAHRTRDVTFNEEASQVRRGSLPQVMAAFRNVTLSSLRRFHITHIPTAFIQNATRPFGALAYLCQ